LRQTGIVAQCLYQLVAHGQVMSRLCHPISLAVLAFELKLQSHGVF